MRGGLTMILVHVFKREIKHKTYLMADSSASEGYEPLFATPELLFEVNGDERTDDLARRVRESLMSRYRTLEFVDVLKPKGRGRTQVFDLTFNKKPASRKRGIIERIIGK